MDIIIQRMWKILSREAWADDYNTKELEYVGSITLLDKSWNMLALKSLQNQNENIFL